MAKATPNKFPVSRPPPASVIFRLFLNTSQAPEIVVVRMSAHNFDCTFKLNSAADVEAYSSISMMMPRKIIP